MIANVFGRSVRGWMERGRAARGLGALVLASAMLSASACRSSGPTLGDSRYNGPPIEINRDGKMYRLILQAPSPGWTFTLDRVKPSLDKATLTVTARKPDPSYMYPQVIVKQELMTTVEASIPIDVYARVAEYVSTSKTLTYQFLGSSGGSSTPEAGVE